MYFPELIHLPWIDTMQHNEEKLCNNPKGHIKINICKIETSAQKILMIRLVKFPLIQWQALVIILIAILHTTDLIKAGLNLHEISYEFISNLAFHTCSNYLLILNCWQKNLHPNPLFKVGCWNPEYLCLRDNINKCSDISLLLEFLSAFIVTAWIGKRKTGTFFISVSKNPYTENSQLLLFLLTRANREHSASIKQKPLLFFR